MSEDLEQQVVPKVDGVVEEAVAEPIAEETEAQQESTEHAEEKTKAKTVQKRIDEITKARHEAEREAAYWRERATAQPEKPADKPLITDFADYAEYSEALIDWKTDKKVSEALAARDAEKAKDAEVKIQQTRAEVFAERQEAVRQILPDYNEVVGSSDINVSEHVGECILESEKGAELAYHLAKNPDVADKLNSMSPLAAAREIGRIEAGLAINKPAPVVREISKAPEPIAPIGSRATPSKDPDKMSADEWRAWRESQLKRR